MYIELTRMRISYEKITYVYSKAQVMIVLVILILEINI
jgi:hypothetical protein